ncbi:MAG TPA: hypothetical protein VKE51_04720 [Vicinamibacterales bacterium]|nr:hypothetical protein [Vicinamibacterales bacterium]
MAKAYVRLSVLLAGALLIPASADSQATHDIQTFVAEISDTVQNPCNGEDVALSGTIRFRLSTLTSASGGVDVSIETNDQGIAGVGASGTLYRLVGASVLNIHIPDPTAAGQVFNLVTDQLFVAQGNAPNSHIIQHDHFTLNANGTLTASHDLFLGVCGS